jgi:hypothetical protein
VPLCRVHHRELHRLGDERSWWNNLNIDPMPIALRLWQQTRGIPPAANSNQQPLHSDTGEPVEEPTTGSSRPISEDSLSQHVDDAEGRANG